MINFLKKLKKYTPTEFMAEDSHYDKSAADYAVNFNQLILTGSGVINDAGGQDAGIIVLHDRTDQIFRNDPAAFGDPVHVSPPA